MVELNTASFSSVWVSIINPIEPLVHYTDLHFFTYRVASALIVLDDLHRLLEYINIGTQLSVSRSMMHVITTMLSMTPPTSELGYDD